MIENPETIFKKDIAEAIQDYMIRMNLIADYFPSQFAEDIVNELLDRAVFYDEAII